jgi:hypothetical protein
MLSGYSSAPRDTTLPHHEIYDLSQVNFDDAREQASQQTIKADHGGTVVIKERVDFARGPPTCPEFSTRSTLKF